jgi:hypothetical protein
MPSDGKGELKISKFKIDRLGPSLNIVLKPV